MHRDHAGDERRVAVTVAQAACFTRGPIDDLTETRYGGIAVAVVGYVGVIAAGSVLELIGIAVEHRDRQ